MSDYLVHKQRLAFSSAEQACSLPHAARVLDFQLQDDEPTIWYLFAAIALEPGVPKQARHFIIAPTGHGGFSTERSPRYVGTAQSPGGLVLHCFELVERGDG
jgi:hypothetical protein